jgi:DNA topoisomerase-1
MCAAFRELDVAETALSKRALQAIDAVAGMLGNTRAVCRKSYIHPAVMDACATGSIAQMLAGLPRGRRGLSADECSVLAVLERLSRQSKRKAA